MTAPKHTKQYGENPVYQRRDGLWEWRVLARNGQIIATSGGQGYTREHDAWRAYKRTLELLKEDET